MKNSFGVAVIQAVYQLLKDTFSCVFFQLAPLSNIVEEITTSCDFYDEEQVLLSLKVLKETHNILVSCLLQDHDFLKHFASLRVLAEVLFVDAFDGNHLSCQVVQGEIDFAKSSFTKYFSNSVKVNGSERNLPFLLESQLNVFDNLLFDFLLGCQSCVVVYRLVSFDALVHPCKFAGWAFRYEVVLLNACHGCLETILVFVFGRSLDTSKVLHFDRI